MRLERSGLVLSTGPLGLWWSLLLSLSTKQKPPLPTPPLPNQTPLDSIHLIEALHINPHTSTMAMLSPLASRAAAAVRKRRERSTLFTRAPP